MQLFGASAGHATGSAVFRATQPPQRRRQAGQHLEHVFGFCRVRFDPGFFFSVSSGVVVAGISSNALDRSGFGTVARSEEPSGLPTFFRGAVPRPPTTAPSPAWAARSRSRGAPLLALTAPPAARGRSRAASFVVVRAVQEVRWP